MNVMIEYDLYNAIKDVNESFTISKIYRNNRNSMLKIQLPLLAALDFIIARDDFLKAFSLGTILQAFLLLEINIAVFFIRGDMYKERSEDRLKKLVALLDDINVKTTYDMLKKSNCYHRVYNFKLNENKLPQILESKYILVPSYDYKGDVVDTSILQEHVVGSHEYVLSVGTPKKVLKLAYSNS